MEYAIRGERGLEGRTLHWERQGMVPNVSLCFTSCTTLDQRHIGNRGAIWDVPSICHFERGDWDRRNERGKELSAPQKFAVRFDMVHKSCMKAAFYRCMCRY